MAPIFETNPFLSFWMGGFEGADHLNGQNVPLDMAASNGHDLHFEADYAAAAALGLRSLRESLGWRLCEPAAQRHAFERATAMASAAQRQGLQLLWTLMHYGTPPDISLHDDGLIPRFADFAAEAARVLKPFSTSAPIYTPVNEIGFVAWAASETRMMMPYAASMPLPGGAGDVELDAGSSLRSGYEIKRRLVRASLAAMRAISEVDPRARFLHIEPVVHVVAPRDQPALQAMARRVADYQWQVWDLLSGRCEPELGGSDTFLDMVGVNYYHSGQWEVATEKRLSWARGDPRRRALAHLLAEVWQRYRRPLTIAETSHVGEGRGAWLTEIAWQVARARAEGVPVNGLCLYPLIDRPDWSEAGRWHRSGLFDVGPAAGQRGSPGGSGLLHGTLQERPPPHPARVGTVGPPIPPPWQRTLHPAYAAALVRSQTHLPDPSLHAKVAPMPTLIVFCHLRWGFVYQRPQHLLSRLARHYRVIFIEEPTLPAEGEVPHLKRSRPTPGVEVLTAQTGINAPGFHDDHLPVLTQMLSDYFAGQALGEVVAWFYTPMALPLLAAVPAHCVVYDCMDELTAFKGAPRQLRQRETALMKAADVVLTGGPSLFEARRDQHANVLCLPSAVDAAHFSPARLLPESVEARTSDALHAGMARPRLGFYGVIDERFDVALLTELADTRPGWQWVMAGPVVKIDPATLPRRPNLHWLGMQPYAVLPYLLAAWDVALLPFALNDSTRFISPTKTLEYMAGGKPIVSTPVKDVADLYGEVVSIAATAGEFIAQCEVAMAEPAETRAAREHAMDLIVQRMSWHDTAAKVLSTLTEATAAVASSAVGVQQPVRFGT